MKIKKFIIVILISTLVISQFSFINFNNFVYAIDEQDSQNDTRYHYNQLTEEAKNIYNAMYEMYTKGIFKTGTEDFDLAKDNKYVTQKQLQEHKKGNLQLTTSMNAARYAFYADYPEIFYVNFQCLSLRVTEGKDGLYHAYIGSGRYKNYYIEGFTNKEQVEQAIIEFDEKVNEIAQKAKDIVVEGNKNKTVEQIKLVHNEIIYNTSYRLESDCTPGNEGFVSTPYGSLVKKQAVCEGYARAFKVILDKLGINNILVQGVHQSEGSAAVPHMWNYVQMQSQENTRSIQNVWYAVDLTLDDPFLRNDDRIDTNHPDFKPGDDLVEGFENTRYCLVGTETMNKEHMPIETVEAAGNYVFKYPELNAEDYNIDAIVNNNGLLVKFKQEGTETEEYKAGDFYISYNGKGYEEAKKEGKYILMKYHEYRPGDEIWLEGKWGYMDPEPYAGGFKDYEDHIYITVPNSEYVEFAVTTLAPSEGIAGLTYQGDESDFVAESGKLYNPNGTYKAKPYIKKQTPPATASLSVGPTYHIDVTYDDELILAEGATEAGYKMESTGSTGAEKSEITNFKFDGKNRVTFDLKFSQMYADDGAMYSIYLTGLVGKNSKKEPMKISYGAINQISCSFSMNKAKNWEVFATPKLLENEDLSMNGWQTSDGEDVSEKLKSRIALVTTRTTKVENDAMNDLMQDELQSQELVTSQTYNISLNVCRKYVVKTGHRLRLALGFPEGYGPEDAGVTFKAYHFMRNDAGEVTGVEEIPCVVTQYGLIVTCNSFSPFAIAVVKNDVNIPQEDKVVIVSSSEGGIVDNAGREDANVFSLKPGESRTITVQADKDYVTQSVMVNGELKQITDNKTMEFEINYNDLKEGSNIIDAQFIAKTVQDKDEAREEKQVIVETNIPMFTTMLNTQKEVFKAGEEFTLTAKIGEYNKNNKEKLNFITGFLEYNHDLLEIDKNSIEVKEPWTLDGTQFNEDNFKFINNSEVIAPEGELFEITLKVKENVSKQEIMIRLTNIEGSFGQTNKTGFATNEQIRIKVQPEVYSSKYKIEGLEITNVSPETKVANFKENIETDLEKVITDKDGNPLADDDIVVTGAKIKLGTSLEYVIGVVGDANGNGRIDTADLTVIRGYLYEGNKLEGIYKKCMDIDGNSDISTKDLTLIRGILYEGKKL